MTYGYKQPFLVWLGQRAWTQADRGASFEIFLYSDDEDDPGEGAWMDSITTEPSAGNYTRASVDFGGFETYIYKKEVGTEFGEVSFDLSGESRDVDSYGIVAPLEYFSGMGRESVHTEGDLVDVFVASAPLDQTVDLSHHSGEYSMDVGAALVPMY